MLKTNLFFIIISITLLLRNPASGAVTDIAVKASHEPPSNCVNLRIQLSYMVTIFNDGPDSNYSCLGILVSASWVLTSHCCTLTANATIVAGVDVLDRNTSDRNLYRVNKKLTSLGKNTDLIQMDRAVQWKFVAPQIRSIKAEEMTKLLQHKKCSIIAWFLVNETKYLYQLQQYPLSASESEFEVSKNTLNFIVLEYEICGCNIGCPVICEGFLTAIVLENGTNCRKNFKIEMLCPILEWIAYYTGETSYFEESTSGEMPKNLSVLHLSHVLNTSFAVAFLFVLN